MGDKPDITRRQFIQGSALAGAGLLVPGEPTAVGATRRGAPTETENRTSDPQETDSISLENEFIRIDLNAKTGDIQGLYHKRTGKQYIAAKEWARAFRLNVPVSKRVTGYNADYSANALDSWTQRQCTITRDKNDGSQVIKVQYPQLESAAGTFEIEVSYSIRLANNSDEATLQLEVDNHSSYLVREVFFPWISGVGLIEGYETDTFVAPNIIRSLTDLRNFHPRDNWEEYPYFFDIPRWPGGYSLTMPWMNHGGKHEGLYLASRCHEGVYHMLMVQNFGDDKQPKLAFAWAIPCYIAPGKLWRTPEIVLSLHSGDWHAAADKYRASLDGWYERPDTPQEFKKAFASFNSFFTSRDFAQIADLAEDIRKYGLRHLVMWNFGDYYPNVTEEDDLTVDPPRLGLFTPQWGGLEKLKAANEKARSLGVSTGIIFSQRLWNKDTLTPELRELAEKWVLRRESGDPLAESWNHQHLGAAQWSQIQPYFGHLQYIMCDAVPDWQNFAIRNISGVLSQGGYSMMFYDEAVENNLCFSREHNHADVSAPCMAAHGFLKSLKTAMRSNNPGAVLIGEGCEMLASQIIDAGWLWRIQSNPEVFRYTLPWSIVALAMDVDPAEANKYFVLGLHLAIMAKGPETGKKLSDFPEFAQHVARLAAFRKKTERFWVAGTFQDDLGLRAAGAFGKVYQTREEVAIILANLTNEAAHASFELDSGRYGIAAATYSTISSSQRDDSGRAEKADAVLKGKRSLGPYEVMAVVFRRQAQKINTLM
jgi:hypothetical protein